MGSQDMADPHESKPHGPSRPSASPPHRIRLRPPWQTDPREGSTRWRRHFNRPTGLDPQQRVWIVMKRIAGRGHAAVNGCPLGHFGDEPGVPCRFDVTDLLRLHNQLELTVEGALAEGAPASAPPADVCLEIHG